MARHSLPEDEEQIAQEEGIREDRFPEEKKSQRMLLLLLLLLILLFAYLYFFTSLIRPRPQPAPPAPNAPTETAVVKQPMPSRTAQPEQGAPETAAAGKPKAAPGEAAKPGPGGAKPAQGEKAGAAPEAKGAQPAGAEAKAGKPGAAAGKMPMPAAGAAKAGKPGAEAKGAKGAAAPGKAAAAAEKGKAGAPAEKKAGAKAKAPAGGAAPKGGAAAQAKAAVPGQAKAAAKPAAAKPAAAKAAAAKAAAAKAAAAGGYALEISGDLADSEVAPTVAKLKRAGISRVVKTRTRKSEEMHRLFLADFASRDEAQEELERLKLAAPEAFMLRENGRYAVYGGSYLREAKAKVEQDRLYEKGVKLLLRKAAASVPVVRMRAGSFPQKGSALRAAEILKKEGVAATVVKVGKP